jgi:protein-S-isoprenylcysteine O-methyltransferase Ste14
LFLAIPVVVWPPETAERAIAVGLFLVGANLFFLIETWASFVERPLDWGSRDEDRRALRLAQGTGVAVAVSFLVALMESAGRSSSVGTSAIGLGLMLLGSGLRGAAMGKLGARFRSEVVVPAGCPLETRGVYAWMRHPSETGLGMIVAGACLLLQAPAAALFAAGTLGPLSVWRVVLEESHLVAAHGDVYRRYCLRVSRFVPWRWGG